MSEDAALLDAAYLRLHRTGPEFQGWLSNHGPMAAEAMVRRGHGQAVHQWLDGYVKRLEEFPRGLVAIDDDWRSALGDPRRLADWTRYFEDRVQEAPWREVVNVWWPRLLAGLTAAATHGVIRVGHALRSLMEDGESPTRVTELAHGLAYWAARWATVTGVEDALARLTTPRPDPGRPCALEQHLRASLDQVPLVSERTGGIVDRLERLGELSAWPSLLNPPALGEEPAAAKAWLAHLVDAAVTRYLWFGHGDGVMLVHSVTAPNAVLRALPALDEELWVRSAAASWAACAALTAIYSARTPVDGESLPAVPAGAASAADAFARAVEHGDEHVIKFADTALDTYARTGNRSALAAVFRAASLIRDED